MRTIALSVTVCGLVLAVTGVSLGSDFDALLRDLSFGDAPTIEQPEALNVTVDQAAEDLKPAPEGFLLPAPTETEAISMPLAALAEPVEVAEIEVDPQPSVDFDEMFSTGLSTGKDAALSAPLVDLNPAVDSKLIGHRLHEGCEVQPQCDSCDSYGSCEPAITCYPYTKPVLPSSTFLQYFRSNRCNTNIWDGYQQKCGSHHDCVMGTCDCFDESKSGCFGSSKSAGCASCDACDR